MLSLASLFLLSSSFFSSIFLPPLYFTGLPLNGSETSFCLNLIKYVIVFVLNPPEENLVRVSSAPRRGGTGSLSFTPKPALLHLLLLCLSHLFLTFKKKYSKAVANLLFNSLKLFYVASGDYVSLCNKRLERTHFAYIEGTFYQSKKIIDWVSFQSIGDEFIDEWFGRIDFFSPQKKNKFEVGFDSDDPLTNRRTNFNYWFKIFFFFSKSD